MKQCCIGCAVCKYEHLQTNKETYICFAAIKNKIISAWDNYCEQNGYTDDINEKGYNIVNRVAPLHDLIKHPGDMPEQYTDVEIVCKDCNIPEGERHYIAQRVGNKWVVPNQIILQENVVAWRRLEHYLA